MWCAEMWPRKEGAMRLTRYHTYELTNQEDGSVHMTNGASFDVYKADEVRAVLVELSQGLNRIEELAVEGNEIEAITQRLLTRVQEVVG